MQYALIIHESDADFATRENPTTGPAYMAAYTAYSQALVQAGVMRGGTGLAAPHAATTVRLRDGKRTVQDGPYADTKEKLGGFYLIEVPDLDAALAWAARCPAAATGSMEVRPTLNMPASG
jgi:hypothetical protein